METTLSSKGQIVIPQQIRQLHGWEQGITFTIIEDGSGLILRPKGAKKISRLEDVIGCAGYKGEKKSLAEMEDGIIDEAKRQAATW